jgi:hypothetical protein
MLQFELVDRTRKGWDWKVFYEPGVVLAHGRQKTRPAARYHAERALFQLLATGWKRPNGSNSIKQRKTRRA